MRAQRRLARTLEPHAEYSRGWGARRAPWRKTWSAESSMFLTTSVEPIECTK